MGEQEYLTTGEFSRWAEGDRVWKQNATDHFIENGSRLTALETVKKSAESAQGSATVAKWFGVGAGLAALVQGAMSMWGHGPVK